MSVVWDAGCLLLIGNRQSVTERTQHGHMSCKVGQHRSDRSCSLRLKENPPMPTPFRYKLFKALLYVRIFSSAFVCVFALAAIRDTSNPFVLGLRESFAAQVGRPNATYTPNLAGYLCGVMLVSLMFSGIELYVFKKNSIKLLRIVVGLGFITSLASGLLSILYMGTMFGIICTKKMSNELNRRSLPPLTPQDYLGYPRGN